MKVKLGLLSICVLISSNDAAMSQEFCGSEYTVQRGDTLSQLAEKAFGSANRFLDFYNDSNNARVLNNNPNLLEVGTTLQLPPCNVDSNQTVQLPTIPSRKSSARAESDVFIPPIQILTGSDYAPFTDLTAPGRGMLTQIVAAALDASPLDNDYQIDFINDWSSHLNILLPNAKYDLGFPWFRPNCSEPEKLPESDRIRCDYEWSAPLFTVPIAFYRVDDDSAEPQTFEELYGLRICRPSGYFIFDLTEVGLSEDKIKLTQPASPDACVTALERGEIDYISLNRFTMEKAIARAGLEDVVVPIQSLLTTQQLHLVAHRNNPLAAFDWIAGFNQGLKQIQSTGLYGRITATHIRRHTEEVAALAAKPLQ